MLKGNRNIKAVKWKLEILSNLLRLVLSFKKQRKINKSRKKNRWNRDNRQKEWECIQIVTLMIDKIRTKVKIIKKNNSIAICLFLKIPPESTFHNLLRTNMINRVNLNQTWISKSKNKNCLQLHNNKTKEVMGKPLDRIWR
jgi:hypothetical protein